MLISTTFGNETFENDSHKYHLFACRSEFFPLINPSQKHLWLAAKQGDHSISRHGNMNVINAVPGGHEGMGKWTTTSYDVPDGFILKIFGSRSRRAGLGRSLIVANIFMQIRENGPMIRIVGGLSGDEKAVHSEVEVFSGRADILTDKEIGELGLETLRPYNQQNVELLFTITELSSATGSKPQVVEDEIENTGGQKQVVKSIVRKRAIQLGE
jgi:hypothetical protein